MAGTVLTGAQDEEAEDVNASPVVLASRYGDLGRNARLIESLARKQPLSPTDFSLSVHNSVLGVLSIANHNQAPQCAVASGENSFLAGLTETLGRCLDPPPETIQFVYVDSGLPEVYKRFEVPGSFPFALAMTVRTALADSSPTLELRRTLDAGRPTQAHSHAREFAGFLGGGETELHLLGQHGGWHVRRAAVG